MWKCSDRQHAAAARPFLQALGVRSRCVCVVKVKCLYSMVGPLLFLIFDWCDGCVFVCRSQLVVAGNAARLPAALLAAFSSSWIASFHHSNANQCYVSKHITQCCMYRTRVIRLTVYGFSAKTFWDRCCHLPSILLEASLTN